MQITDLDTFLKYYQRVKGRTSRLFPYIPPDKIEWKWGEKSFSFGDLIRHLASIERDMYAENARFRPSRYNGCGPELAEGYEAVIAYYKKMQEESYAIFSQLSEEDLHKKCKTPAGIEITLWKWLRAMLEHEIHHRGQIYVYLAMLGIESPPIYGLTSEQVADLRSDENTN
ncbi:MAG: DinB family protein [Bacteroidia bacterium]|nr:DinB family protein [Bacteroidia bacterium]